MKSLLIIGAGQYGHLVKELAEDYGYEKIAFSDDNSLVAIGKVSEAERFREEYVDVVVAIGNPAIREKLVCELEPMFRLATLIHPTAFVPKGMKVMSGTVWTG